VAVDEGIRAKILGEEGLMRWNSIVLFAYEFEKRPGLARTALRRRRA